MGKWNHDPIVRMSKLLSSVLRHNPEKIGIELDSAGWVDVTVLRDALLDHGRPMSKAELEEVVKKNDKKRFEFNENRTRIRACQGHSVEVDLALEPCTARDTPAILYHGTSEAAAKRIWDDRQGLKPGTRQHVHLSADYQTAVKVGMRHGRPCIFEVDAHRMIEDFEKGSTLASLFAPDDEQSKPYALFRAGNGVYLAERVPIHYLNSPGQGQGARFVL